MKKILNRINKEILSSEQYLNKTWSYNIPIGKEQIYLSPAEIKMLFCNELYPIIEFPDLSYYVNLICNCPVVHVFQDYQEIMDFLENAIDSDEHSTIVYTVLSRIIERIHQIVCEHESPARPIIDFSYENKLAINEISALMEINHFFGVEVYINEVSRRITLNFSKYL